VQLLPLTALGRLGVRRAALVATLSTMMLSTAKWTAQISTIRVAGMGEKPDPAVNAARDATRQLGMGSQEPLQHRLILPDNRLGTVILVPVWPKREKLLDGDDKKSQALGYNAESILHILVLPHRRERIERQGEVFLGATWKTSSPRHHKRFTSHHPLQRPRLPARPGPAILHTLPAHNYLEEISTSSFQVAGPFSCADTGQFL